MKRISCILRNKGSGWFIISSGGHAPWGVASVSQDATGLTLNYDFTAKEIHSMISGPDETYATLDGLIVGATPGLTSARIQFSKADVAGPINPSTIARSAGNIFIRGFFS